MENVQAQTEELYLEDIIFRIGEIPESPEEDSDVQADQALVSPDARATAAEWTRDVHNEELRHSLTRVISRAISSAQRPKELPVEEL